MSEDIKAEDCRIVAYRDGQATFWMSAVHIPTGIKVVLPGGGEIGGKRRLMEMLQADVRLKLNPTSTPDAKR